MGKASGVSRRRRKKFNYNVNRKKLHKKAISLPKITCEQIKKAWDPKKSYWKNMEEIGLSGDPNKTIPPTAAMDMDTVQDAKTSKDKKTIVVKGLEADAHAERPKTLRLATEAVRFCVYMIEKYGEDYKAMARDPKNYYQETATQIKNRINKFKHIPQQWNGYLRAKGLLTGQSKVDEVKIDIDAILGK